MIGGYYIIASLIALINERRNEARYRHNLSISLPNYLVYKGRDLHFTKAEIEAILLKYFPYYKQLDPRLRGKFIKRLRSFIQIKTFVIRHHEGFNEMPVLISAAAIQITFGLEQYLLPWFVYIQIHNEAYFADNALRVLAGHVHNQTITLAWSYFLKGYSAYDGCNVGLHEMAHALYYQHIIADERRQQNIAAYFDAVMIEGAETFKACRPENNRLYTDYAFTNLQEFWAESIELFFEKPDDLRLLYPGLYGELVQLLHQDPAKGYFG